MEAAPTRHLDNFLLVAATRRVFLLDYGAATRFDWSLTILPLAGLSSSRVQELLPEAELMLNSLPEAFAWPSDGADDEEDAGQEQEDEEQEEQGEEQGAEEEEAEEEEEGGVDEEGEEEEGEEEEAGGGGQEEQDDGEEDDGADDEALAELRLSLAAEYEQRQQRPAATLDKDQAAAPDDEPGTEAAPLPRKSRRNPAREFNFRDKTHRKAVIRFFLRLADGRTVHFGSVARNVVKARIGSGDYMAFKFFFYREPLAPGTSSFNMLTIDVREATMWSLACSVPGVLRLERVHFFDGYLVLAMPAMASSLSAVIRQRQAAGHDHKCQTRPCFDYDRIIDVGAQLIRTYQGLHRANVFHRDFKPDNVLMRRADRLSGDLRVCDFGISCFFDVNWLPEPPRIPAEYPGTRHFMSPECYVPELLLLLESAASRHEDAAAKLAAMAAIIPPFVRNAFAGGAVLWAFVPAWAPSSPAFAVPAAEVYAELGRMPWPDGKADVFSFGVTMVQLVTLRLLTSSRDKQEIAWRCWLGDRCEHRASVLRDLQLRLSSRSHRSLFRAIVACLHPNPARRPTFDDLASRDCFAEAVSAVKDRDNGDNERVNQEWSVEAGGDDDDYEVQQPPEPLAGGMDDGGREGLREAERDRDLRGRDAGELDAELRRLRLRGRDDLDVGEKERERHGRQGPVDNNKGHRRLLRSDAPPTLAVDPDAHGLARRELQRGGKSRSSHRAGPSSAPSSSAPSSSAASSSSSSSAAASGAASPPVSALPDGDDTYPEQQAIKLVEHGMDVLRTFAVDSNGMTESPTRAVLLGWWAPVMLYHRYLYGSKAACTTSAWDWVRGVLKDPGGLPPALASMLTAAPADADTKGSARRLGKLYLRVLIDAGLVSDRHERTDWFEQVLFPVNGFIFPRYQQLRSELTAAKKAADQELAEHRAFRSGRKGR